jgi:hypothetical protein
MVETVLTTDPRPRRTITDEHGERLTMHSGVEALTDMYRFDPDEVFPFLDKAGAPVTEVLMEAPAHIIKLFGQVPLNLEVVHDPEEDFELLFIEIKTDLPAGRAIDLLDTLDDEWWLNVDTSVRKMLAVDV